MTKRVFIAIPLSEEVKNQVSEWVRSKQSELGEWRVIPTENLHLTLHFLRTVEEFRIEKLKEALKTVKFSSFEIQLFRFLAFPASHRATVLTLAGHEGNSACSYLHSEVANVLESVGYQTERRVFIPHVTVFRSSVPLTFQPTNDPLPSFNWRATRFELIQSETLPTGSRYLSLASTNCRDSS